LASAGRYPTPPISPRAEEYALEFAHPQTFAKLTWRQLRRHRLAIISLVFIAIVMILAAAAPLVSRYGFATIGYTPLAPSSWQHFMGTDSLGRDLWSRVVYGARISLEVGIGSQLIAAGIGIPLGALSGFLGGRTDMLLMRATDIVLTLPTILLALLFLTVYGTSTFIVMLAIGLATWPVVARIIRSQVLQLKQEQFVEAAYSVGCSRQRVLIRHILPGVWGPVIVQVTFGVSQAIFTEAFLSFIGLGAQPPTPSWGRLLVDGFEYIRTSPHLAIFPSVAITLTILAFNFLGDGLRDALDPHTTR
jgi:ABC-type dipeptide/oligopeptide/nickel transport system permease subunit